MITQLCEQAGSFFSTWGLLILVLAVFIIPVFFFNSRHKKEDKMAEEFVNGLKVGDKVRTYSGVYGTILSMKEIRNDKIGVSKIGVLEIGEAGSKATMVVDLFSIYCVVEPTKYVNADGIQKIEEAPEVNVEEAKVEPEAQPIVEPETEKKTSKTKTSKTKKSTSKK